MEGVYTRVFACEEKNKKEKGENMVQCSDPDETDSSKTASIQLGFGSAGAGAGAAVDTGTT